MLGCLYSDYYLIVSGAVNANTNSFGSLSAYKVIGFGETISLIHISLQTNQFDYVIDEKNIYYRTQVVSVEMS